MEYTTDLKHILDGKGKIVAKQGAAFAMSDFLAKMVYLATIKLSVDIKYKCFKCNAKNASHEINQDDNVAWVCNDCKVSGVITNWRGSIWDMTKPLPSYDVFVERLKSERLRLNLSIKVVSECMGVKEQTLIQYEKGLSSPIVPSVLNLEDLGFNMDYLMGFDDHYGVKSIDDSKIVKASNIVDKVVSILGVIPTERQRLELGLILYGEL